MTTNTPLIELKTVEDLLLHLTAAGWTKTPTKEPNDKIDQGHLGQPAVNVFDGSPPADPPCWETLCDARSASDGDGAELRFINLHPGMGEDHGDVYVQVVSKDGNLGQWMMLENYAGSNPVPLDPINTTIEELRDRLSAWVKSWPDSGFEEFFS